MSSESAVPAGEDGLSTEGAEADPLAVNNLKEDKDVDHMDSAICDVSAEEPASKVKKAEEKITPTYNDYAVEIWEFNGSSVWNKLIIYNVFYVLNQTEQKCHFSIIIFWPLL